MAERVKWRRSPRMGLELRTLEGALALPFAAKA